MSRIFYGVHDRKLDYKGRLGVPEDLLTAGGAEWRRAVIIRDSSQLPNEDGTEPQFASVFDMESWEELLRLAQEQLDADESRLFMHKVVGEAATVDVDAAKRITVPDRFLRYASIERQAGVRVVGAFNHIELWNPGAYGVHVVAAEKEGVQIRSVADLVAMLARSHISAVS
jgi:DNA-binding transcriptional regulator/RsmH inhibitor MraZ